MKKTITLLISLMSMAIFANTSLPEVLQVGSCFVDNELQTEINVLEKKVFDEQASRKDRVGLTFKKAVNNVYKVEQITEPMTTLGKLTNGIQTVGNFMIGSPVNMVRSMVQYVNQNTFDWDLGLDKKYLMKKTPAERYYRIEVSFKTNDPSKNKLIQVEKRKVYLDKEFVQRGGTWKDTMDDFIIFTLPNEKYKKYVKIEGEDRWALVKNGMVEKSKTINLERNKVYNFSERYTKVPCV